MLSACHSLLNMRRRGGVATRLYPYLSDPNANEANGSLRFRAVDVPDCVSSAAAQELNGGRGGWQHAQERGEFDSGDGGETLPLQLAFTHGDFVRDIGTEHYGLALGSVDAVVTCFFIDAVPDIEALLAAMAAVLKPGGIWLNVGPLQWHSNSKLRLTLGELILTAREHGLHLEPGTGSEGGLDGVTQLEPMPYRSVLDLRSTKPQMYRPLRWLATKRVDGIGQAEEL